MKSQPIALKRGAAWLPPSPASPLVARAAEPVVLERQSSQVVAIVPIEVGSFAPSATAAANGVPSAFRLSAVSQSPAKNVAREPAIPTPSTRLHEPTASLKREAAVAVVVARSAR